MQEGAGEREDASESAANGLWETPEGRRNTTGAPDERHGVRRPSANGLALSHTLMLQEVRWTAVRLVARPVPAEPSCSGPGAPWRPGMAPGRDRGPKPAERVRHGRETRQAGTGIESRTKSRNRNRTCHARRHHRPNTAVSTRRGAWWRGSDVPDCVIIVKIERII